MNYKWSEDKNIITSTLPKVVHKMNANMDGDVMELFHPMFVEKYGENFFGVSQPNISYVDDVVQCLLNRDIYATVLSYDKLYVTNLGIHLEIKLRHVNTNKYRLVTQIVFLLQKMREEQEEMLNKTIDNFQEQMVVRNNLLKLGD